MRLSSEAFQSLSTGHFTTHELLWPNAWSLIRCDQTTGFPPSTSWSSLAGFLAQAGYVVLENRARSTRQTVQGHFGNFFVAMTWLAVHAHVVEVNGRVLNRLSGLEMSVVESVPLSFRGLPCGP